MKQPPYASSAGLGRPDRDGFDRRILVRFEHSGTIQDLSGDPGSFARISWNLSCRAARRLHQNPPRYRDGVAAFPSPPALTSLGASDSAMFCTALSSLGGTWGALATASRRLGALWGGRRRGSGGRIGGGGRWRRWRQRWRPSTAGGSGRCGVGKVGADGGDLGRTER